MSLSSVTVINVAERADCVPRGNCRMTGGAILSNNLQGGNHVATGTLKAGHLWSAAWVVYVDVGHQPVQLRRCPSGRQPVSVCRHEKSSEGSALSAWWTYQLYYSEFKDGGVREPIKPGDAKYGAKATKVGWVQATFLATVCGPRHTAIKLISNIIDSLELIDLCRVDYFKCLLSSLG